MQDGLRILQLATPLQRLQHQANQKHNHRDRAVTTTGMITQQPPDDLYLEEAPVEERGPGVPAKPGLGGMARMAGRAGAEQAPTALLWAGAA